jgi:hypothetical protein
LDAQRAALTMAITLDKSSMLEAAANAAEDRKVRLAGWQAEVIEEIERVYFRAVDLPFSEELMACLLRSVSVSTGEGETARRVVVSAPDDVVERACEQVREVLRQRWLPRVRAELRSELEAEVRRDVEREVRERERRALPVPEEGGSVVEVVEGEVVEEVVGRRPSWVGRSGRRERFVARERWMN